METAYAVTTAPSGAPPRRQLANAIRILAMDMVEHAGHGHPGMPMGMADIAEVLWRSFLRHNPRDPSWPNRDRFILSNGHGSALLYALLHLSGYDLPMAQLQRFRRRGSLTPGHPEHDLTPGVETTTGPLGQGFANAVGMAIAEAKLAREFNRPGFPVIDHRTYVFLGDGCLMEGISHEAASLAGTLGLGKLIAVWDDNRVSIDSASAPMELWFSEDVRARFEAYGWQVIDGVDGHDAVQIERALAAANLQTERPTLICCRTEIGFGAPTKGGSGEAHGAPLGSVEASAVRLALDWKLPPFEVDAATRAAWDARERGDFLQTCWNQRFADYAERYPVEAHEMTRRLRGDLPPDWGWRMDLALEQTAAQNETLATRKASQQAIAALTPLLPELIGGSADLAASNLTLSSASRPLTRREGGNYLYYGVREFAMAAVMNGLALHGGLLPFGATFLTFSDYARNALRMAAMMRLRAVYVFTHDSIGVGEDGPTHQPVEHAACLRYIPNLDVWRPCDGFETLCAWRAAVERRDGPSALLLSRQSLPANSHDVADQGRVARGGYVLAHAEGPLDAVIIATGSEVAIALAARALLKAQGYGARVVSLPSTTVFDRQDEDYRASVLPAGVPRLAIEAGLPDFWRKYVGLDGDVLGVPHYGESASATELFQHFGLTAEQLAARTVQTISRWRHRYA